ncbi:MAG TPA: hypothetical protein VJR89_36700 [Polyangiales bacterium]|nr:hypothetical protein [Polyangiales bacterium]
MLYHGQAVHWRGHGTFRASSGLPQLQHPNQQCTEGGPVPEGTWSFLTKYDRRPAQLKNDGSCELKPSKLIQDIPSWDPFDPCSNVYEAWGYHRVRLEPHDDRTRLVCKATRDGFYLHDSRKGYSHGCIEVEGNFFYELRVYSHRPQRADRLIIQVRYFPNRRTSFLGGSE